MQDQPRNLHQRIANSEENIHRRKETEEKKPNDRRISIISSDHKKMPSSIHFMSSKLLGLGLADEFDSGKPLRERETKKGLSEFRFCCVGTFRDTLII
ncbi:hypothetical protein SLE2022_089960 [Rubroshorea leprosula]